MRRRHNIRKYGLHSTAGIFVLAVFLTFSIPGITSAKKVLRVGVPRYAPPFSFVDKNPKLIRGYCVDLAKLLAGNMKAGITFYAMKNSRLLEGLREGKIDLVSGLMISPGSQKGIHLVETGIRLDRKYFVNNGCLTVTCYKDLPGHTVAVEKDRDIRSLISVAENVKFTETGSQQEALALVDSGKAQVYISDASLTTLYLIQKAGFQNIKEVGMPIETVPLALAVREDNTELLTAISVSLGKILENRSHDVIHRKWLGRDIQFDQWSRYIKYILGAVGVIAAVLLAFIFWNFMLQRKVGQITRDLQRSEQKYRDLIESSPDMIHLIGLDGRIKMANKIALDHLGFSEAEIASLRLHDLVIADQQNPLTEFMNTLFHNRFSKKELTFQAKNGTQIHVEMVGTTISGFDESEIVACCFSRDLTERKRLEEDLIHSDRLAIMGQMAAGIAHEINNPLGIILANAEDVLSHEMDAQSANDSLKTIERNAIRAGNIIEDLLSFTRPHPPEIAPIDLPQLIDSSLLFLKQKLKQKKIMIDKHYPAEPVVFNGDENLIQQLLINLILNAVQAIKREGRITIRVMNGRMNGQRIGLEVKDNGIGIPESDLQKVFDPFFTSRKEKGFGLGLFTSRIIVEKHQGMITAYSKEGEGTVMSVEFPLELKSQQKEPREGGEENCR